MVKNFGFTFIEILVSLFLLSIALFYLNSTHLHTLHDAQAARYFSMATLQLNNLTERLYAMRSESELKTIFQQWNIENKITLPQGVGYLTKENSVYHVILTWGEYSTTCTRNHISISGCLRQDIPVGALSLS